MDALAPFAVNGALQQPPPLAYLRQEGAATSYVIALQVQLQTQRMRDLGTAPETISQTNFDGMYWSVAQQLAHATVPGAVAAPGDLFASGTISGEAPGTQGSFIELTWNGERPLLLDDGETRTFLEDGDDVMLCGWCERPARRIGFGSADQDESSGRYALSRARCFNPRAEVRGLLALDRGLREQQRRERIHHDRYFVGRRFA